MNCKQVTPLLVGHVDGTLDHFQNQAVLKHLRICTACKNNADDEALLQRSFKSMAAEKAPENFCQNTFNNLRHQQTNKTHFFGGISSAIAASIAIWLVVMPMQQNTLQPESSQSGIEMVVNSIENVRLSFDAPDSFKQVTLTINLPKDIELSGFPGQRILSWKTSLNSGKNVLNLPFIARGIGSSIVEATISNSNKSKIFKIKMIARPQKQASLAVRV